MRGLLTFFFKAVPPLLFLLAAACTLAPRTTGKEGGVPAEIEDLVRLPQTVSDYAEAAGEKLAAPDPCRDCLLAEFRGRYFRPWTERTPFFDLAETKSDMVSVARGVWYGENRRTVDPSLLDDILSSCDLESFPSRNESAIAVAPGHLRGLPTVLPLFEKGDDYPFDKLAYPQVKLNEPLRVLHQTTDGVWLFVETPYSNGWIEARDVALVDRAVARRYLSGDLLVTVADFQKVPDGRGGGYRTKIGTLLPLVRQTDEGWEVAVVSADDNRKGIVRTVTIPAEGAAPFPLPFNASYLSLIGDQLAGQPYGWGELYGLRDCSAMLRDLFLPFGIWLPRTSLDQIASVPATDLSKMGVPEKEGALAGRGVPFLTLVYKPGHIMLYVGNDSLGRPLVFHSAWSIHLSDGPGGRIQYIGKAVVTTLEPGKELGVVAGSSLVDRITAFGTITDRCRTEPPAGTRLP